MNFLKSIVYLCMALLTFHESFITAQYTSSRHCAWLEKGGVFAAKRIFKMPVHFVQSRYSCRNAGKCNYEWSHQTDLRTLHIKWQGTQDMRDYDFQMRFCTNIYTPYHRYCGYNDISSELRQVGTWLLPVKVNCRCHRTAELFQVYYQRPIETTDVSFRPFYYKLVCRNLPQCEEIDSPCYAENVGYEGRIYYGEVLCTCPPKYYCPLYMMKEHPRQSVNGTDGRITRFVLRCTPRKF